MIANVIGAGKMGLPITYGMAKLGCDVCLSDSHAGKMMEGGKLLEQEGYSVVLGENYDADITISAAPIKANYEIAKRCALEGIRYVDLGGNPEVSARISGYKRSVPFFPDMGLAPGWANILAEQAVRIHPRVPDTVNIRVGGLPANPQDGGILKYSLLFNSGGLYNEYTGPAEFLRDGKLETATALSELDDAPSRLGPLEAFLTKGGLNRTALSMQTQGVQNCMYRTLRYPGHHKYLKFMLDDCGMDEKQFCTSIERMCKVNSYDLTVIQIDVDDTCYEHVVHASRQWSAMQMATAFPTCAVAYLMAQGKFDNVTTVNYEDVPYGEFRDLLDKLMPAKALTPREAYVF
jgi:saccharopine dehydrogenase-like NADP-dependent oxidoreductase